MTPEKEQEIILATFSLWLVTQENGATVTEAKKWIRETVENGELFMDDTYGLDEWEIDSTDGLPLRWKPLDPRNEGLNMNKVEQLEYIISLYHERVTNLVAMVETQKLQLAQERSRVDLKLIKVFAEQIYDIAYPALEGHRVTSTPFSDIKQLAEKILARVKE